MLSSSSVNSSSYLNIDSKHSILRHRSNSGSILNDETPIQWKNINSFDIKRAELADSAKLNKTEPLETKFIQSCLQPSLISCKSQPLSVPTSINSLSSNSCVSSVSTSSASSTSSNSNTSSASSFTPSNSIPLTSSTKPEDTKNAAANLPPQIVMQSTPDLAASTKLTELHVPCLNESNESTSMFLQNSQVSNSNLITVPSDSPDPFKRSSFGSFRDSSYKKQKENYLTEKKRITNDMLTIMRDESIIVLADWLKIRGSLKNWVKLYVILKPGIMLLYKSDKMKAGQWVGTIILNSCQLLERPSKKHGFCFKLFHPMEKSIWASKGPAGETYINMPYMLLPTFYLIFRAPSEKIGNIWMDAIELTLKSGHLLKPTSCLNATYNSQLMTSKLNDSQAGSNTTLITKTLEADNMSPDAKSIAKGTFECADSFNAKTKSIPKLSNCRMNKSLSSLNSNEQSGKQLGVNEQLSNQDIDIENKHFNEIADQHEETMNSDSDGAKNSSDDIGSLNSSNNDEFFIEEDDPFKNSDVFDETKYIQSPCEEFGELGNKGQTEEVDEEGKGLIYCLVKQVRPGMDLSKVVLPTFILEPRSFLEKLTDFYYHSDILTESISNDDPYERMKSIVKFYLSGFYKKPKGLKKPYNPILGEVFRSHWYNPKTDSKTFYIAEQVSHHPPITSFYVTNRKEGFCIYGTILARSKFYGNSVSAIMEGNVKLILLNRGEEYVISMPYANCKGILIGKLTMELGGKVNIECVKTGYSAEIEFKLKPLLGGIEASNLIEGKIKFAKETIATLSGKWDGEITLNEKRAEKKPCLLWNPTKQIIESRLKRFIVPLEEQKEFESEILWLKVSDAIKNCDQNLATEEKSKIEGKQRQSYNERKLKFIEYLPQLFTYDALNKEWIYNYSDLRPWDTQTDLFQYEFNFKIITKTKHNLSKLKKQFITSPHNMANSLISRRSASHLRHHRELARNDTVSTKCINESFDFIMQHNELKQRLDLIEQCLKHITTKLDRPNFDSPKSMQKERNDLLLSNKKPILNECNSIMCTQSSSLTVALIAWFVGLISAFFFNYLFKFFE